MTAHTARLSWSRNGRDFTYDGYDRTHRIRFEGGIEIEASAAPAYKGDASKANPEEMLVAALSSCHMLTFLAICARKRIVVDAYEDDAAGVLTRNDRGKLWVSQVTLAPKVVFSGAPPRAADLDALHQAAHDNCFVANSVKTEVVVQVR